MQNKLLFLLSAVLLFLVMGFGLLSAQINWTNPPDTITTSGYYKVDVDTIDLTAEVDGIFSDPIPDNVYLDGDGCLILWKSGFPYRNFGIKFYVSPPSEDGDPYFASGEFVTNFKMKYLAEPLMMKGLKNSVFQNVEIDSSNRAIGAYTGFLKYENVKIIN